MDVVQKRSFGKRSQIDPAQIDAENDFHRRAALNKQLGMTARNPYAFQLSDEELEQAEADVLAGSPPVPIITATNELRMLIDPWREGIRRQERDSIPDTSPEERRERYAGGRYADQIRS